MARPKTAQTDSADVSRRVLVNIKRDQTTATPRVVWRHEIPILEGIFQEGNVVEIDPTTLDEGYNPRASADLLTYNKQQDVFRRPSESLGLGFAFVGDPRAEYERLGACYGMHPEVKQSWVENVYGRFSSGLFARTVGTPDLKDLPEAQLRQLLISFGYTLPIVNYESTEAERKAASAEAAKFQTLPKDELLKLAADVGVELG